MKASEKLKRIKITAWKRYTKSVYVCRNCLILLRMTGNNYKYKLDIVYAPFTRKCDGCDAGISGSIFRMVPRGWKR